MNFEKLGFTVQKASRSMLKDRGVSSGVVVSDTKNFSEAFNRGLRANDIIIDADRKPVGSIAELERIVKSKKPGDALMLRVKGTDGSTRFIAVMIPNG
jgi:serine protease Do